MSYAYYRFFAGDYGRDTLHLGWYEDLAYRRLIDLYNTSGKPIRNDRAYILRAVRATEPEQQTAVDNVLAEFFTLKADGWHQQRCDAELGWRCKADAQHRMAAKVRWNKRDETRRLDANAMHTQCDRIANQNQNQNYKELKSNTLSGLHPDDMGSIPAQKIPIDNAEAVEILAYLNRNSKHTYRVVTANLELIKARLKSGVTPLQIKEVIHAKCAEWLDDPAMAKYLRPATLFNRTKFEQYLGELGVDNG